MNLDSIPSYPKFVFSSCRKKQMKLTFDWGWIRLTPCLLIAISRSSGYCDSVLCFTSKKADPNVGHLYTIFRNVILASSGLIPVTQLFVFLKCFKQLCTCCRKVFVFLEHELFIIVYKINKKLTSILIVGSYYWPFPFIGVLNFY